MPANKQSNTLPKDVLVRLENVTKAYAGHSPVVQSVDLTIRQHDRLTLVGENGAGKTTLIKLIMDEIESNEGEVLYRPNVRVGYLPQDLTRAINASAGATLIEVATANTPLADKAAELSTLSRDRNQQPKAFKACEQAFHALGGYQYHQHMYGFDLVDLPYHKPFTSLSGGEKTKVFLINLLLGSYDLLILDEPTNHIDIKAIDWLETYLSHSEEAILLITHDRTLLNNITRSIYEIDIATHKLSAFRGKYSDYINQKRQSAETQLQQFMQQQSRERKLLGDNKQDHQHASTYKPVMRDRNKAGFNARGERAQKGVSKLIQRRQRELKQIEHNRIHKPFETLKVDWEFGPFQPTTTGTLVVSDLNVSLTGSTILENINLKVGIGERVLLTGDNGAGKTTLLETISGLIPIDSGCVTDLELNIGYLTQENQRLDLTQTVKHYLTNTKAYQSGERTSPEKDIIRFCALPPKVLYKTLDTLSMGQLTRVKMTAVIFNKPDIILLDEPTNHLDFFTAEYLESELMAYRGGLLVVTHDRWLIKKLKPHRILCLKNKRIHVEY